MRLIELIDVGLRSWGTLYIHIAEALRHLVDCKAKCSGITNLSLVLLLALRGSYEDSASKIGIRTT
jgi:hypothetical protein